MDDALPVQILEAQGHLVAGQPQHLLVDFAIEQLCGLSVLAELQQDVVVLLILEMTHQLDHIRMIKF